MQSTSIERVFYITCQTGSSQPWQQNFECGIEIRCKLFVHHLTSTKLGHHFARILSVSKKGRGDHRYLDQSSFGKVYRGEIFIHLD